MRQGNFLWSGQITLFLLYAATLVAVTEKYFAASSSTPWRAEPAAWASAAALGAHVAGGVVFYFLELTSRHMSWW